MKFAILFFVSCFIRRLSNCMFDKWLSYVLNVLNGYCLLFVHDFVSAFTCLCVFFELVFVVKSLHQDLLGPGEVLFKSWYGPGKVLVSLRRVIIIRKCIENTS